MCGCGGSTPVSKRSDSTKSHVIGTPTRFIPGHQHGVVPIKTPPNPSGLCMCGCGTPTARAQRSNRKLGHVAGEFIRYANNHNPGARGSRNANWKGGSYVDERGYIRVSGSSRRYQHQIVMERHIGRELTADEIVHHTNGNRSDNRIENLELMTRAQHTALHNPRLGKFKR
jgi:hypothetical protein